MKNGLYKVEVFSVEELQNIIDKLQDEPLKWQCYVELLIDTGMRRGECLGLKWEDIDFESYAVQVRNNVVYVTLESGGKGVQLTTPKNGKSRTVYISERTATHLKKYQNSLSGVCEGLVFPQDGTNEPMNPHSVDKFCRRFSKKNNIADFHAHKLRHSFATRAIENGADVASVSKLLGHSDTSITLNTYTHASAEAQKKANMIAIGTLNRADGH